MLEIGIAIIILLAVPVVRLLWLWRFPHAEIYENFSEGGQIGGSRYVGYVAHNGAIYDLTLPIGQRKVGSVTIENGRGVVRARLSPDKEPEICGFVDDRGEIYLSDGANEFEKREKKGWVSVEGRRKFFLELWLFRHSEIICEENGEAVGEAVEKIRLSSAPPNAPSLLARAGAALLLYRRRAQTADEIVSKPDSIWEIALPTAFIFSLVFLFFKALPFSTEFILFPLLGKQISDGLAWIIIFFIIGVILFLYKHYAEAGSDEIRFQSLLMNRETGIGWITLPGFLLSVLGIYIFYTENFPLLPLFIANGISFAFLLLNAPRQPWTIERGWSPQPPPEIDTEEPRADDLERFYEWKMETPLRDLNLEKSLRFRSGEIDRIREKNPFYLDWKDANRRHMEVGKRLVLDGEKARQVKILTKFITQQIVEKNLTEFETVQIALNFVQSPNIAYELDKNCAEIKNCEDYWRLPLETLFDKRGDCDCKSVLAAALLRNLGFPVLMLINDTAEHAAIAVGGLQIEEDQVEFILQYKGKSYLFCETTGENWRVGQLSMDEMRDFENRIIDLSSPIGLN